MQFHTPQTFLFADQTRGHFLNDAAAVRIELSLLFLETAIDTPFSGGDFGAMLLDIDRASLDRRLHFMKKPIELVGCFADRLIAAVRQFVLMRIGAGQQPPTTGTHFTPRASGRR